MPTALLSQYLPADHIIAPLHARTFRDALAELLANLVRLDVVRDAAALSEALSAARGRDVVAIGRDAVLPHVRTDAVDRMLVSLGIAQQPLDAAETGLDVQPRLVALVIAPPEAATLYLQTVAAIARFFASGDVVARLQRATSPEDVLAIPEFGALRIRPELTVQDLMMHDVTTISADLRARDAVNVMVRKKQRAVPVVDDKHEVLGILTEWDVLRALVPHIPRVGTETEAEDPFVREIMTRSVLCVPEEMGLEEAVNLMINKRVEQCPVVRGSVFVGMLARADIIRKLFTR